MEKITLSGVQETMLQTVFARAQESMKQYGICRTGLLCSKEGRRSKNEKHNL